LLAKKCKEVLWVWGYLGAANTTFFDFLRFAAASQYSSLKRQALLFGKYGGDAVSDRVYDIPRKLFDLSEFYLENSYQDGLEAHVIFVHLYRNVTREWIFYAEDVGSRDLIFCNHRAVL
jgi:hypothetical protein